MIPDDPSAFENLPAAFREQAAEFRRMARIHRAAYEAYIGEGFTEHQALELVKAIITK